MNIIEATAALERAGHTVTTADRVPGLYDVAGIARDVTEGQLIQLAHRHGAWRPAVEQAHSIYANPPK